MSHRDWKGADVLEVPTLLPLHVRECEDGGRILLRNIRTRFRSSEGRNLLEICFFHLMENDNGVYVLWIQRKGQFVWDISCHISLVIFFSNSEVLFEIQQFKNVWIISVLSHLSLPGCFVLNIRSVLSQFFFCVFQAQFIAFFIVLI